MLRHTIAALLLVLLATAVQAQSAGEIEYEVTRQVSPEMMARFGGGGGDPSAMPTVITLSQTVRFAGQMATYTMPRPGQAMMGMMPPGAMGQMRRFMPFENKDYVDFSAKKLLHYMRMTSGEDTTTWYLHEEPFEFAVDWKVDKKTKKILGYECQKATATWRDSKYTVWFTTDVPGVTFSPINGLVPPQGGLVLSLETDDQSFVAKKVDLQAKVLAEEVTPAIAKAKAITAEEAREMRRAAGERMRAQFQQQMPRQ